MFNIFIFVMIYYFLMKSNKLEISINCKNCNKSFSLNYIIYYMYNTQTEINDTNSAGFPDLKAISLQNPCKGPVC